MNKRRKRRRNKSISELNITNLVDVVFALLIIFMITAPMMTQGVQVDLPDTESEAVELPERVIQVVVTKEQDIYIDERPVSLRSFSREFAQVFAGDLATPVYLSADREVPYGVVMRLISEIQNAGVVNLGFLTEPLKED
ncbi:ExbD/TolR family protein [Chitinivibrio alkaliphilus]|uniref:Protein TolR n=1 Tax=Chitinivibrio alkaliphilus ACht1 TaxID=1313304 RepID=U7DAP5_9BACT|nr:biopolymer transporter ExbD [Chitinivibrio alkaliphilus]ERP39102.1 protein TolR [Chitinivibrio alkaliphilus ACht1]